MKIKRLHFNQLRNNEHFQSQTEFKALVERFNPDVLKINPLFSDIYLPLYYAEDEALVKITKNSLTEKRGAADRRRDKTFRGLADTVNAGLNHFEPELQASAQRVKIVLDTYGNVAKLPLNEETAAIYNLTQELLENYAEDAGKLEIVPWINKLNDNNEDYKALVKGSNEEEAAKTELKAKSTRAQVDLVMSQIIKRVEALIVIEGEENYAEFVRHLNLHFDKYANTLAQRRGAAKARKKKEQQRERSTKSSEI